MSPLRVAAILSVDMFLPLLSQRRTLYHPELRVNCSSLTKRHRVLYEKAGWAHFQRKPSSLDIPATTNQSCIYLLNYSTCQSGFVFTRMNKQLLGRFYSYCCSLEPPVDQLFCFYPNFYNW